MKSPEFTYAISGAIILACAISALFFLRFWKKTRDRLFVFFSVAFCVLTVERFLLILVDPAHELRPYIYCVRLLAFALILAAILDKNRKQAPARGAAPPQKQVTPTISEAETSKAKAKPDAAKV